MTATTTSLTHAVSAEFMQGFTAPAPCTESPQGGVVIRRCPVGAPSDLSPRSAGTLSITGGLAPVSLVPNAQSVYPLATGLQSLWNGGQMLTVSASGAVVPAFTTTLQAPGAVRVSAPVLPAAPARLTVPRNAPLMFSWTGGTSTVQITLIQTSATTSTALAGSFAASAGSAVLAPAALAQLTPGDAVLVVQTVSAVKVQAGLWPVDVVLTALGTDSAGLPVSAPVTIQ